MIMDALHHPDALEVIIGNSGGLTIYIPHIKRIDIFEPSKLEALVVFACYDFFLDTLFECDFVELCKEFPEDVRVKCRNSAEDILFYILEIRDCFQQCGFPAAVGQEVVDMMCNEKNLLEFEKSC